MSQVATVSKKISKPSLEIQGRRPLAGEIQISGAKNSALVLMTAALLTEEPVQIENIPQLTDIDGMVEILLNLGVKASRSSNSIRLQAENLRHIELPYELVNGLRARFFCIGPLLAKLGRAEIP